MFDDDVAMNDDAELRMLLLLLPSANRQWLPSPPQPARCRDWPRRD